MSRTRAREKAARHAHRGQMWSLDFISGAVVLVFILLGFMVLWNDTALRWNLSSRHMAMEVSAYFAAESLLASPGEPEGWEMLPALDDNISAIGLVNGRNELNRLKMERLASGNATSYEFIKGRLGLQRYDFGMRVTSLDSNVLHYEFGRFSGGGFNNSRSFERFAILDGEPVIVHMEVWGG